ncbi:Response regulator rcp1 [Hartmannibacter diazotrophicus]|uniref:Response regulator rcp1 n=1 Tax=Hartmannibacter diazotrophicus TaxID=1482074 RepID=A0A2C9D710_9HYPH|nr:response regulator [Hartmannibacter diazotrophicus]SON56087.1 Response regulator rcp1 [Hartmannibacter diazotrophicus]
MKVPIHVLLVEDNPADADLTRETLEMSKLHVILSTAIDGVEGLRFLRCEGEFANAQSPDLILLDLNLPRLDGRQFLAQVRADPKLCAIPVVVLTSSEAEKDIVQSYSLGANCYVSKPVDLAAFQSIVRSIEGFWFTVVKLPPAPNCGA